jgi:MFS family permease
MAKRDVTDTGDAIVSVGRGLRSRWALVALSATVFWLAGHALRPLVPLRLSELGATDWEIGAIIALYSSVALVVAMPGGRLMDRLGILRVLVASLSGMVLVGVGYALAVTPTQIMGLMVANGLVELGAWLALQALISHAGKGAFLSRQMSLFSFGWGVGVAVGPMVGTLVFDRVGFAALGWLYAGLALLAMSAVFVPYRDEQGRLSSDTEERRSPRAMVVDIVRRPAIKGVLLSSYVALFVNAIRTSFYPLYLERAGVSLARIGILLSVIGVMSLLIRLPLPALLRRWGAGRVLVWSMWLCLVPMAITPWIPTYALLLAAAVVIGAAYGVNPPITVELMALHTKPTERGLAMGMRITSNRLSQVTQPLLFGGLASTVGMAAAFPASGVLLAVLTVWTWREADRISSSSGVGQERPPSGPDQVREDTQQEG